MSTATMSRKKQVLAIEPLEELVFTGPANTEIVSSIRLNNPSDSKVCFKIKTTAPKKYSVKPASGLIEPQGEVDVAVGLLPSEPREVGPGIFLRPLDRTRDRFLVQSVLVLDGREQNQDRLWRERAADVMDTKLRSTINLTEATEEEVVVLTKDRNGEGIDEGVKVAEAKRKTFTEEVPGAGSAREVQRLQEEVAEVSREYGALQQEVARLTEEARGGRDELLSFTYLYLGVILLLVGVFCGKVFF